MRRVVSAREAGPIVSLGSESELVSVFDPFNRGNCLFQFGRFWVVDNAFMKHLKCRSCIHCLEQGIAKTKADIEPAWDELKGFTIGVYGLV